MSGDYTYIPSKREPAFNPPPHYYGDTIRVLFLIGGIVLMVTTALFRKTINVPVSVMMLGVIVLVVSAGFTTHKQRLVIILDLMVSLFSTIFFENIVLYGPYSNSEMLYWIYQALALNFLVALYFSVKTFRSQFLS